MGTGIKPKDGDYDIDVGVQLDCNINDYEPVALKEIVRNALTYQNRTVEIKRPCITVKYIKNSVIDYHVDFPIYATDSYGKLYLASGKEHSDAENKKWILSNPTELIDTIKNKFSSDKGKQFRRCTRYLKKWRNEYGNLDFFKSIAITSAVYEHINVEDTENDNQALLSILNILTNQFIYPARDPDTRSIYSRLKIFLPAHENLDLLEKLTCKQMKCLQAALSSLKETLVIVENELDTIEACKKLRKAFGSAFPIPVASAISTSVLTPAYVKTGSSA